MDKQPVRSRRRLAACVAAGLSLALVAPVSVADAAPQKAPSANRGWHGKPSSLPKVPLMVGTGGAVSSVDQDASQVGIDVLRRGGNAADAAVATAAALGVTEPYSAGIGGGGFLVYFDAASGSVTTIDGRETAPATYHEGTFLNPDGTPMAFNSVVRSGLSVGVPGTPALWAKALELHGTWSFNDALKPAEQLAHKGFIVDETFRQQTASNAEKFSMFPETARIYMPGGELPVVGSTFTNRDMARAYRELRTQGIGVLYHGAMGEAVVAESTHPTTADGVTVAGGEMTMADLADYEALTPEPIHSAYHGYDVYGMPVPSSGGTAVAEILNLMDAYADRTGVTTAAASDLQYLHRFSEASATAFADRNRWVGDVPGVPVAELINPAFAAERACGFDPAQAQPRPIPFGSPDGDYADCAPSALTTGPGNEGQSTTHLTVMDQWGNVAAYTLTIEATGGSGITVPGYGFILNNELTDFNFGPAGAVPDPNLPGPGKRPRSSMSPTIVLHDGEPFLALGTPGGATIITTVAQILLGHLDRGLPLVDAVAAARLSSRNGGSESAEPAIVNGPLGTGLTGLGHRLSTSSEIGAATAIRSLGDGRFEAAAETVRRGGGSAMVVHPEG